MTMYFLRDCCCYFYYDNNNNYYYYCYFYYYLRTLPDIQDLLEPLESAISRVVIPAITNRQCGRDILALPVRLGGLGVANPSGDANLEYTSSVKVTAPLVEQIVAQVHQLPEDSLIRSVQQEVKAERAKNLEKRAERLKEVASQKTRRALDLATEKGSSMWLTSLPLKEMGFNLNKREFRDGLSLRHDWSITDIPSTCLCGEPFTIDHAMICMRGVFVIQRNNELRDLEAELLNMVCKDVVTEPALQDVEGEQLTRGSNKAQDARLDIHARGFWEPQRSAFFDVRVCHPNAESYRDLEPQQIYRLHENEKKRKYSILKQSARHRTWNIHPSDFYNNWWNGKRVLELPQQTSRVDCYQERKGLRQNDLMDTSKNLLCTFEIRINLSQRN